MSKFDLRDKVAIVTGGAGGIGTSIAIECAKAGARVVVAARSQERLEKVAAEIANLGGDSLALPTDVTVPEQVDTMVQQTLDRFGRVDSMVNNAGGAMHIKKAEELSPDEWDAGIALNLTSVFLCSVAAGKVMMQQQSGKIINISSVAGIKGVPDFPHYGAAKAGVINLTKSLAAGWGRHNIHVNCVAPGLTATKMLRRLEWLPPDKDEDGNPVPPLQFPHGPEHVANLVVFLASEASDHITGETIPIRALLEFDR